MTNNFEMNYSETGSEAQPGWIVQNTPNLYHSKGKKQEFFKTFVWANPAIPSLSLLRSRDVSPRRSLEKENFGGCLRPGASQPFLRGAPGSLLSSPHPRHFCRTGGPSAPTSRSAYFCLRGRAKAGVCWLPGCARWRESAKKHPPLPFFSFFLSFFFLTLPRDERCVSALCSPCAQLERYPKTGTQNSADGGGIWDALGRGASPHSGGGLLGGRRVSAGDLPARAGFPNKIKIKKGMNTPKKDRKKKKKTTTNWGK